MTTLHNNLHRTAVYSFGRTRDQLILMPLEKNTDKLLKQLSALDAPEISVLSPEAARELSFTPPPEDDFEPVPVASVVERHISVGDAHGDQGAARELPIRIYTPLVKQGKGALVYFHGGGWVLGDLDSHDAICRRLSGGAGITVISVGYRLAPETVYPGPFNDCYAATTWVADNADLLGIDALRIAVGGDSAGGNLAAAVALKARDEAWPTLRFQLLIYPVTDARFDTASYRDNAWGYLLTRDTMMWFWDHYVPNESDRTQAYASPLRADSLTALPPALVMTAEYDPLRDEGEAYANALRSAGVQVTQTRYTGLIHGFFNMWDEVPASRAAMRAATTALSDALS